MEEIESVIAAREANICKSANNFLALFVEEVKKSRLKLSWTQMHLATALRQCGVEVTQGHISRLETGQRDPSISLIIALATLLSISLDEIISRAQLED